MEYLSEIFTKPELQRSCVDKDFNLIKGNCLEELKKLPDNSVDCIVTSPPYNKGYWSSNRNVNNYSFYKTKSRRIEYENYDDNLLPSDYENFQRQVLTECIRVLKPTGSIFYNHIDILKNHLTIPPLYVYDFPVKQVIIWNRKNTPKLDKSYFLPVNEYIYWIKKDKESKTKFNRKNAMFTKNIWDINPDKHNNFPAPFPVELPLNCILSTTDENDIVLDPFMGSGTTGVACRELGIDFVGTEIDEEYYNEAVDRITLPLV